jgi:hypothetical protein
VTGNGGGVAHAFNHTSGEHHSVYMAQPPGALASGYCAEWIVEDPNGGEPDAVLGNFGTVTFTGAMCFGTGRGSVGAAD